MEFRENVVPVLLRRGVVAVSTNTHPGSDFICVMGYTERCDSSGVQENGGQFPGVRETRPQANSCNPFGIKTKQVEASR